MTKSTFLNYTTIDYLNEKDMEQALIRSQVQRIKHYPKLKELGYPTIRYIDVDGAQVMYLQNKQEQVLAFRGTEPTQMSDVQADLKAWKSKSKTDGKVHDGFYDEVNKVWDQIKPLIKNNRPIAKHIDFGLSENLGNMKK